MKAEGHITGNAMNTYKIFSALAFLAATQSAAAVSFDINYTRNHFQVQQSNTFTDLVAAHHNGEVIGNHNLAGLDGLTTTSQISGDARNHSIMMTTHFSVAGDTQYEFQVGADWGRGGGIAIYNEQNEIVSEQIFSEDIWWGKNWNNSDVISTNLTSPKVTGALPGLASRNAAPELRRFASQKTGATSPP